jgi:uncharacterized protein YeaO (DUF488 family)
MQGDIKVKRAYEDPEPGDGIRVLADRLWPRGLSKDKACIDIWIRDAAPSSDLRKAYHASGDYKAFREGYFAQLDVSEAAGDFVKRARGFLAHGPLTLVCASRDPQHSNASALKDWLEEQP